MIQEDDYDDDRNYVDNNDADADNDNDDEADSSSVRPLPLTFCKQVLMKVKAKFSEEKNMSGFGFVCASFN